MCPNPDARLGVISYLPEALSGFIEHRSRWRTMPWMVLTFANLVVPLGIVSIVLVMLQPAAVGHWCTLCMITFTVDEVVAMGQFWVMVHHQGKPFLDKLLARWVAPV